MRKGIVAFMTAVLLTYIMQGSIWYTMPFLFTQSLASNFLEVGILIGIIPLIEIVAAIPFGYFVDFGKIKNVAFASMLSLLSVPFLYVMNTSVFATIGALLLGAGGVGIWIVTNAHVANVFGKKSIRYIGYEFAIMGLGWTTGPIIGGLIYSTFGSFLLAAVETVALAVASLVFIRVIRYRTELKHRRAPKLARLLKIENRVMHRLPRYIIPFLILSFLFSFLSFSIWVAVPLLTLTTGASIILGGFIVGVVNIPYIIGDALSGKLYVRGQERRIVGICMVLAAISMLAAALLVNQSFYSLLIFLASVLFVTIADVGVFSALIDKDRRDTGEISALATISGGFGAAFASVIAGATVATFKLYAIAAVFGVLVILYLAYLRIALRKTKF